MRPKLFDIRTLSASTSVTRERCAVELFGGVRPFPMFDRYGRCLSTAPFILRRCQQTKSMQYHYLTIQIGLSNSARHLKNLRKASGDPRKPREPQEVSKNHPGSIQEGLGAIHEPSRRLQQFQEASRKPPRNLRKFQDASGRLQEGSASHGKSQDASSSFRGPEASDSSPLATSMS